MPEEEERPGTHCAFQAFKAGNPGIRHSQQGPYSARGSAKVSEGPVVPGAHLKQGGIGLWAMPPKLKAKTGRHRAPQRQAVPPAGKPAEAFSRRGSE